MNAPADPSWILSAGDLGRMFGRSREWGRRLLRRWEEEQERGGPRRVFWTDSRRGRQRTTTLGIVDYYIPRRHGDATERRIRAIERDVNEAFRRIAELERTTGRRR